MFGVQTKYDSKSNRNKFEYLSDKKGCVRSSFVIEALDEITSEREKVDEKNIGKYLTRAGNLNPQDTKKWAEHRYVSDFNSNTRSSTTDSEEKFKKKIDEYFQDHVQKYIDIISSEQNADNCEFDYSNFNIINTIFKVTCDEQVAQNKKFRYSEFYQNLVDNPSLNEFINIEKNMFSELIEDVFNKKSIIKLLYSNKSKLETSELNDNDVDEFITKVKAAKTDKEIDKTIQFVFEFFNDKYVLNEFSSLDEIFVEASKNVNDIEFDILLSMINISNKPKKKFKSRQIFYEKILDVINLKKIEISKNYIEKLSGA